MAYTRTKGKLIKKGFLGNEYEYLFEEVKVLGSRMYKIDGDSYVEYLVENKQGKKYITETLYD